MPTGVAPPEPLQTEPTKSREIANKIEVIYLSLIDALPHAVTIFQDEQIVFANKTALDMFRLASPADLSELHPLQFVSEKDKERLEGYLRRRLAGDQDLSDRYETILCRSNGEEFPAEVRVKTFLFGGRIASQVVITDVTDRKAAEERLRLLAAVVEQCDEGIAVIDPEGHIAFLNFAFAGIHGYSPDELLNTHVATLYSSSNMLSLAEARWEMRQTGHFSGEVLHLRKDGTEAPVLANCCVLRDEEGAEAGFVIAVCEISHIKATEKLLRLSFEKAVSRASQMEDKVREVERDLEISQNKLREHAERLERSREALKMVLEQIQDRRERLEQDIYRSLTTTVRPILYQLQAEKLPESARLLLQTLELNINNIFSDFEVGPIAGDGQLTPREIRICELISSGLSSKEVADIIGVSETTVLSHRRNIRKKLGLKSSQGSLSRYLKSELFEASKNR